MSVLSGLLLLLPVAGCGMVDSGPSAKDVAAAFLASFASGNNAAAADRTDAPETARRLLDTTREELSPKSVSASVTEVEEGSDQQPTKARFDVSWRFGRGRVWKYSGSMELNEGERGWKVHWKPSVIHPKLAAQQTLDFREQHPKPAPVLGRNGVRMMGPEKLVRVTLVPGQVGGDLPGVAEKLDSGLEEVAPTVTSKGIVDGVKATPPDQAYTVVTLRRADYGKVKSGIYELPGVRFPTTTRLVSSEQDYGSQVLPGVAEHLDERVHGTAGWSVVTRNVAGAEVRTLHEVPPKPAEAVKTTLDDRVQRAAEKAVDPIDKSAMIVAMQPSSGDLLTVAQNAAADRAGAVSLTGQYPPGSTFKIVTALAALETGRMNLDTPVQCPGTTVIGNRLIPNSHEFDLGTVPLRTAFAQSCNTTFAHIAADLPSGALSKAAKQLGLGADFVTPGITTITGKVPTTDDRIQRAANGFGQGTVLASPFGMALVTSSALRGEMVEPKLIRGEKTKTEASPSAPSRSSLDQLRTMMREVVTGGTATELKGMGEVAGKTGTAQFGDGTRSHGWFVGYRGDMAFAVLVTDAGSSERAVAVARNFLKNT